MHYSRLKEAVLSSDGEWFDDEVMIVGVRGHLKGEEVENEADLWNDTIYVATPDMKVFGDVQGFCGSVDPGRVKNANVKGLARLMPGQYLFCAGLHRGKVPALRQDEGIWIERIAPETREVLKEEKGWFGINIHPGGYGLKVGDWSHGCQVIKGDEWDAFWELIRAWGQDSYLYTLLKEVPN